LGSVKTTKTTAISTLIGGLEVVPVAKDFTVGAIKISVFGVESDD